MRIALVLLFACGHDKPSEPAPGAAIQPVRAAAASAPACSIERVPSTYPAPARTVAIGDIHGDLQALRAALRTAGAIDEQDAWIGGPLVVVQTGDVVDRNDDDRAILDYLEKLEPQARAHGGSLLALLGNHELMNAQGDFRYVTPGGFRAFGASPDARATAFAPGGEYAKQLAHRGIIAIVGKTVFSHAGVLGDWATHVDDANRAADCWLAGQGGATAPDAATAEEGPVWTRALGGDAPDCAALAAALKSLGAERMVVGHTVQRAGITSACGGALWRIDVGLGKEYGGPIQVLELGAGEPKILDGKRL